MPIEDQLEFESDLCVVKAEVRGGVNEECSDRKDRYLIIWETYRSKTHLEPLFLNIKGPIPYLENFSQRLQDGWLAPSGRQIRSATVSDYLTSVGQRFANMDADNPRLNKYGKLDFWLARQKCSLKKRDKQSVHVKPMPVLVVMAVFIDAIIQSPTIEEKLIANMICIAFFYCMRRREYTGTTSNE